MENILDKLSSLDNVQLRAELLKLGERVGPVTPTTRPVFLSRLAHKLHRAQCPEGEEDQNSQCPDRKGDRSSTTDTTAAISEQDSPATGRKGTAKSTGEKEASMYYVVIQVDCCSSSALDDSNTVAEQRVFTEKQEALAFMKKNAGSRLKVFPNSADVKRFMTQCQQSDDQGQGSESKVEGGSSTPNPVAEAEKLAFKGPKNQELVQLRRMLEKGDVATVKTTVWNNPRYLITGADTPVILHEGMRHNALHIAAKANQAAAARMVMETVLDPNFTKLLYSNSNDTQESRSRRIMYLFDLYLNSPDKGCAETPLHIACKMGHPAVVQSLVMYSATDRARINKFGEKPEQIICSRYKGDNAARVKEEIQELLKGLCLVPLLRSVDNITLPVVGPPCSPDDKIRMCAPTTPTATHTQPLPLHPHTPMEPRLTLSAFAGPMSPSKAQNFQRQWTNPRCSRNTGDAQELTIARRTDAEKGYERIGRKLAKELQVPWTEYWQFLDAFADFSSHDGLRKLEQHLSRQKTLLAVQAAMDREGTPSDEDSAGLSGTDSCGEGSQEEEEECFYSCAEEEESGDEKLEDSNSSNCHTSRLAEEEEEEEEEDVFEDSLDSFSDTKSYMFGQRLQLKKSMVTTHNGNNGALPKAGLKASSESIVDTSTPQNKKPSQEKSDLWSYRDNTFSEGEEKKPSETSAATNTSHSFDATNPCAEETSAITPEKARAPEDKTKPSAPQTPARASDRSFNTLMTELSEDLETKLIFSPEGKVVPSNKRCLVPDVGLCLGKDEVSGAARPALRGRCPVEVLIKYRKGSCSFLADVVLHSSSASNNDDDVSFEDSIDDLSLNARQKVMRDVKVVTRNKVVFQYVRRLVRPVRLTVGLLEADEQNVAQHWGCVTARLVRQTRTQGKGLPHTACYIYGSTASKTDLDVMRAMCETDVDPDLFPAIHTWLSLVSGTQQESRDSWPSPAKLRHQHHLSYLHQNRGVTSPLPLPISPLVQGRTVTITSTPLSSRHHHQRHHASGTDRQDPSSPPPLMGTPRTWLFQSPS
ncbi:uncharacterized protein LOC143284097 [Babylonia areolata]|uniref:uncharacterized protein LOC143284097 n=1 Tax=Babylonia areolata TaxID=304850 RepID=UPI003FD5EAF3